MKRATLLAAVLAFASPAHADPTLWDVARDPHVVSTQQALTRALRARQPRDISPETLAALPSEFTEDLALRAVTVLEEAGGEALPDPAVWFYLGDSLVVANHGQDEEGVRLLRRALAAQPDAPQAARAWSTIGIASDRLHRFQDERAAFTEALRFEWDKNQRAEIYSNRGEASMSLGLLREARADYETSLALTDDSEIHALAAWGLAVALARDEDLPDALRRAWEATSFRFHDVQGNVVSAIEMQGVFYTPDYEVHFYRALGAMASAEHADKAEERKTELEYAISQWQRYLAEARPAGDRWTSNAEYHLLWCKRRLGSGARPRTR